MQYGRNDFCAQVRNMIFELIGKVAI